MATRKERAHMGDRLEALLREKGWRQAELARRLGWSRQRLSQKFGESKWDADTIFLIAQATGVPESYFFRDDGAICRG